MLGSRWTLKTLRSALDWLEPISLAGLWRLCKRLGITWKRGRDYIHSPDPDYEPKLTLVQEAIDEARKSGGRVIALYVDEFTFYRQPTVAQDYCPAGSQPLARRSLKSNTTTRVIGALNVLTGQVIYHRGSVIGLSQLRQFSKQIAESYPEAERIYGILDNWPIHFHPDVLVSLEEQESPFTWHRPSHWRTEPTEGLKKRYEARRLPIQLLALPTWAPWTNPIEKLWRQVKQEVLHLHRQADDLALLRCRVDQFLDQYQNGSTNLLRYVGLLISD